MVWKFVGRSSLKVQSEAAQNEVQQSQVFSVFAGLISAQTQRRIHRGGYQPGSRLQALAAAVVSEVMESNVPPSAQTYRKYFNIIL